MLWKIRDYVLDEDGYSLTRDGDVQSIEPLQAQLLGYLAKNAGRVINRDDLIRDVWQNIAVTDNAVNRVIARLRKALEDDPKSPKYIATVPRRGYRLIAPVEQIKDIGESTAIPADRQRNIPRVMGAVIAGLLAFWMALSWQPSGDESQVAGEVIPLTRDTGVEVQPTLSGSGKYLAYAAYRDGALRLYLRELGSGSVQEIGAQGGFSGGGAWSKDDKYLAYLHTTEEKCEIHRLRVSGMEILSRESVYECPANSYGKIIFAHDADRLIFAQASPAGPPYSLYSLNIPSGDLARLEQPDLFLAGNSEVDLHPTENRLLITSPDAEQWLRFYELDLDTDELKFLFRLNEYVCCPIWSNDGERIVLIGEHPAYELISLALDGNDRRTLFQAPHRVHAPGRSSAPEGYIYQGGVRNRDIVALDKGQEAVTQLVSSSVDDRLPAMSPDGTWLSWVSDQSGDDQIWLRNTRSAKEQFSIPAMDSAYYYDLNWSPDSRYLAGTTINGIHLVDAVDRVIRKLDVPQTEIRGTSWKDAQTVAFSVQKPGGWQVQYLDITTGQITVEHEPWSYISFAASGSDTLWFSASGKAYYGDRKVLIDFVFPMQFLRRKFAIAKRNNEVFYSQIDNGAWFLQSLTIDGRAVPGPSSIFQSDHPASFSLGENTILMDLTISDDADIFRVTQ